MPKELMELSMECNATGIGSPLFSNDDIVIPKLIDFGYEAMMLITMEFQLAGNLYQLVIH